MQKDHYMRAKLAGFKTRAPIERVRWKKTDDKRLMEIGKNRYEELLATKE